MAARPATNDLYVAEQRGRIRRITIDRSEEKPAYDLQTQPVLDISDQTKAQGERGLLGSRVLTRRVAPLHRLHRHRRQHAHRRVPHVGPRCRHRHAARALGDRPALPEPQRRPARLRAGRLPLHRHGRRRQPRRSERQRPEHQRAARQDPAHRPDHAQPGQGLRHPRRQPVRRRAGGAPEIWLYGVRNPWRFSFDTATDDLWIADVGQDEVEEIDWLPAANDGAGRGRQPRLEPQGGRHDLPRRRRGGRLGRPCLRVHPRRAELHHHRRLRLPRPGRSRPAGGLRVRRLLHGRHPGPGARRTVPWPTNATLGVSVASNSLSSFGQDQTGEVYVLSTDGTVYRIDAA